MKKFYILLIALLMVSGARAQTKQPCSTCLPEGIEFTTQVGIDSFQINYPGCTEILGDLTIIDEFDITNLNELSTLTSIGGNLTIYYSALTSLTGLEGLQNIGGALIIGNSHSTWSPNPLLENLTGLNNVITIGGDLFIYRTVSLTSLSGLDNLTSIGGNLKIGDYEHYFWSLGNLALTSLTGLGNLTSVGGSLAIVDNDSLTSLTGLENINTGTITGIEIVGNSSLSNCAAQSICDYLAAPNGSVDIYNNATGCNNPSEIAIECGIALPCLPYGNYHFLSQADINNFQANFPNCTDLKGIVRISGYDINNLEGLGIVTSIDGSLEILWNPPLTSLSGLENLKTVGGSISIGDYYFGNSSLTSLSGLNNINGNSISNLTIWYNPLLSSCAVKSICDYLVSPNGTVEIHDNAQGCNSGAEVIDACKEGVDESAVSSRQSAVNVYPNPSSTAITISMPTTPEKNTFMTLYSINGKQIINRQITEPMINVDVSGLSQGVYFVKVADDRTVMVGKFIKQ